MRLLGGIVFIFALHGISFPVFFQDKGILENDVGRHRANLIRNYILNRPISRMTELLNIKGIGQKTVKILEQKYGIRVDWN